MLRSKAVVEEGRRLGFFSGIKNFFELGSGPGTVSHLLSPMIAEGYCVETSLEAIQLHRGLEKFLNEAPPADLSSKMGSRRDFDLGVFSYVLNETGFDIINSFKFQSLLIIEPSTQALARGLMDVRKRLLEKGFYLVAPCTHQGACPLLEKSGKDWCHHRISVEMPGWFIEIEKFLPMKNETVTFSYLLASRNEPIRNETEVRVIGDVLVEKGKTRQAVCFDGDRRFLSWLHKEHDPSKTGLTRGSTFYLSQIDASIVSNEVRVAKPKS